jgi:Rifampin ADP-ribosyl transferase
MVRQSEGQPKNRSSGRRLKRVRERLKAASDTSSRRFYNGTRADLRPGDLIQPGYSSNYTERRSPWVYFSETVHAATWGAELAKGEGSGRIYLVEPTGSIRAEAT